MSYLHKSQKMLDVEWAEYQPTDKYSLSIHAKSSAEHP